MVEINGLEALQKRLDNISRNAQELAGNNRVDFDKLFNPSFMNKYTDLSSIKEFLDILGVHNQEELNNLPKSQLDTYTSQHTRFTSWHEMLQTATKEYVVKSLKR
ncbi:hypothetical protein [Lactobacillus paragasseri]|uniref:Uncharacterized protein n=1 Tax=Lactobacillus paragasseri TaxID=2107999 RepID=A0ABD4ZZ61_9LACO|nr:hypothetical protein [Lactobacillus paragasseri]MDK7952181.1 hypothetical protein [Lactobacillus paragasseri]MDO6360835.1 hypothetical protein [Lactobacillus paragasseri]